MMNLKEVADGMVSKGEKMHEGMDAESAKEKAKMHIDMAKECLSGAGVEDVASVLEELIEGEAPEEGASLETAAAESEGEGDEEPESGKGPSKAMIVAVLKKKQAKESAEEEEPDETA